MVIKPGFIEEKICKNAGYCRVAGVDEAGRGPLAGPVVAAALILPENFHPKWADKIADSKYVTAPAREFLFEKLNGTAAGIGVGVIDSVTIDMVGIAKASRLAMKAAVKQIDPPPDYLLIDFFKLPEVKLPQKGVIEGDSVCFSIACASIVAKVTRDRLMLEIDKQYPGYGFSEHKGYATREHFVTLRKLGPSPVHRTSFQPVRDVIGIVP